MIPMESTWSCCSERDALPLWSGTAAQPAGVRAGRCWRDGYHAVVTAPAHVQAGLNVFQALMPHQLEMMALYQNKMTSNRATYSQQIIFERFRKGN